MKSDLIQFTKDLEDYCMQICLEEIENDTDNELRS